MGLPNSTNTTQPLPERLRDPLGADWDQLHEIVLPRVLAALRRRFGPEWNWLDQESAVASAIRTAWRRISERADPKLEDMTTPKQLEDWLVATAGYKFIAQIRKSQTEKRHLSNILKIATAKSEGESENDMLLIADQLLTQLRVELPEGSRERQIFEAKLQGQKEVEIANAMGCSTRQIRNEWKHIRDLLTQSVTK